MFHPFLTVQAGTPRHCLSIALALLAIKCETFTSNITNYYYTHPQIKDKKIKLMQDVKYIRRLLMVGKICGVSIVDYGKRSNN